MFLAVQYLADVDTKEVISVFVCTLYFVLFEQ